MVNNFLFYDNDIYVCSNSLFIKDDINIHNTYLITNDYIYNLSGFECKLPIIKNLHFIR